MNLDDLPAPKEGFVITHVLVVADLDRSREFYRSLLGGQVLLEGDPVIIKVANTWLTLVAGGGPTDDKPGVSLGASAEPGFTSGIPQRARGRHLTGLQGVVGQGGRVPH